MRYAQTMMAAAMALSASMAGAQTLTAQQHEQNRAAFAAKDAAHQRRLAAERPAEQAREAAHEKRVAGFKAQTAAHQQRLTAEKAAEAHRTETRSR